MISGKAATDHQERHAMSCFRTMVASSGIAFLSGAPPHTPTGIFAPGPSTGTAAPDPNCDPT